MKGEISLVGKIFVLVEMLVHTMHSPVKNYKISQELRQICINGKRHFNLQIKLYYFVKYDRNQLKKWNRFDPKLVCFGRNFGAHHALSGHKDANISKTKTNIEKRATARQSTYKILSVCEILSKSENNKSVWLAISLFWSKNSCLPCTHRSLKCKYLGK